MCVISLHPAVFVAVTKAFLLTCFAFWADYITAVHIEAFKLHSLSLPLCVS
jgi:hypothetical protein